MNVFNIDLLVFKILLYTDNYVNNIKLKLILRI